MQEHQSVLKGLPACDLQARLEQIRGETSLAPDASVVVPVNAQGDLAPCLRLVGDVANYEGPHRIEIILVVNNYPPGREPEEVAQFRALGLRTLSFPDLRVPGEAAGFSARIPGVRAAASGLVVLFDADCRIPNPGAVIDWYVGQFRRGVSVAYTHVSYYDYLGRWSVRFRLLVHHAARWAKRNLLRIPTTRGSSYAVKKTLLLGLYESGMLADDMNVGPTVKTAGNRVAYGGTRELHVLTSGRMFTRGWLKLIGYFRYRFRYNLRVLPVQQEMAARTGREGDPVRRYLDNRPVR